MRPFLASLFLAGSLAFARPASAEAPPLPRTAFQALPLAEHDIPVTRIKSVGLVVGGSILLGLGAGVAAAGGITLGLNRGPSCPRAEGFAAAVCEAGTAAPRLMLDILGVGAVATGAIFVFSGLPMVIVGAQRVPVPRDTARPEVRIGPGSASLHWVF